MKELHVSLMHPARIKLSGITRSFQAFDARLRDPEVGEFALRVSLEGVDPVAFSLDHIYVWITNFDPWKPINVRGIVLYVPGSNISSIIEQPFQEA